MWIPVHRMVAAAQTCSPEQAPATYAGHQVSTCVHHSPQGHPTRTPGPDELVPPGPGEALCY